MELLSILYQLLFMPLQIIFEIIYYMAFKLVRDPGVAIIALSFVVNLLVLPLYNRADAVQEAERDIELKLSKGVEHIKKTFSGDEQLMMLQTYYRQNGYSPLDSIKGSITLFLEIPFFVAAYQFLSRLELLNGASLGPIKDLGVADALLNIGGLSINVLPFIMTGINLASAYIFTKDLTRKTKIQLYGMACFFLVFLYNSPAGLVCYWTLNNIFNLIKTIICKMEDSDKGINVAMFVCSVVVMIYGLYTSTNYKEILRFFTVAVLLNARFMIQKVKRFFPEKKESVCQKTSTKIFVLCTLFLALLIGTVIPSAVIESSPQEFIVMDLFTNPLLYLLSSGSIAFGTFIIWGGVFYYLANHVYKVYVERVIWILCGVAIVNYLFFGNDLGVLTSTLQYENGLKFNRIETIINTVVLIIIMYLMNFIWNRYKNIIGDIVMMGVIALICIISINIFSIQKSVYNVTLGEDLKSYKGIFSLSKSGKNIIVIVLDRAMGTYIPYMFKEKPLLKEQLSGFTYFSNTISHGGFTNFGMPGVFGGYEYIPSEMNKRDKEFLVNKHNEALKVMPILFDRAGYKVTLCDPPYANYQWISDLSIFDEFNNINKYNLEGKYNAYTEREVVEANKRNFYCFGITKCFPVLFQKRIYDSGNYCLVKAENSFNQEVTSLYTATNISKSFMKPYNVLMHLPDMTVISEKGDNFVILTNNTTHEPCMLQEPEYTPVQKVDNTEYLTHSKDRFHINGRFLEMKNTNQIIHYQTNMSVMLQLGKWFDYMRNNNVYDNTRIVVVSDHGRPLKQIRELILDDGRDSFNNIEFYYPLLMVKDFNSTGFSISDEFMTNADTPMLVTKDVLKNPINPFTGKRISNELKHIEKQYVLASYEWNVNKNNGTQFLPGRWYSVHTNIWNKNNWKLEKEKAVLPF